MAWKHYKHFPPSCWSIMSSDLECFLRRLFSFSHQCTISQHISSSAHVPSMPFSATLSRPRPLQLPDLLRFSSCYFYWTPSVYYFLWFSCCISTTVRCVKYYKSAFTLSLHTLFNHSFSLSLSSTFNSSFISLFLFLSFISFWPHQKLLSIRRCQYVAPNRRVFDAVQFPFRLFTPDLFILLESSIVTVSLHLKPTTKNDIRKSTEYKTVGLC